VTVTPVKLFDPALLTASAVTYYTSPANTKTKITKLTITNVTSGALTATIYLIASGGSASDTNTISKTVPIAAYATYEAFEVEGHVLNAGDFIQAFGSSATSLSIQGSGVQFV
jgi:hypothetical protein